MLYKSNKDLLGKQWLWWTLKHSLVNVGQQSPANVNAFVSDASNYEEHTPTLAQLIDAKYLSHKHSARCNYAPVWPGLEYTARYICSVCCHGILLRVKYTLGYSHPWSPLSPAKMKYLLILESGNASVIRMSCTLALKNVSTNGNWWEESHYSAEMTYYIIYIPKCPFTQIYMWLKSLPWCTRMTLRGSISLPFLAFLVISMNPVGSAWIYLGPCTLLKPCHSKPDHWRDALYSAKDHGAEQRVNLLQGASECILLYSLIPGTIGAIGMVQNNAGEQKYNLTYHTKIQAGERSNNLNCHAVHTIIFNQVMKHKCQHGNRQIPWL